MTDIAPVKVVRIIPGGPAELTGLCPGLELAGIGGHWLSGDVSPVSVCSNVMETKWKNECPLELVVLRNGPSEEVKLKLAVTLGLQLKGNQPVFISKIDKGVIFTLAHLMSCDCIPRQ